MAARKGFKAAYCAAAVACLGKGYSHEVLAARLGVSPRTVYAWIRTRPDFAEAVARGRAAAGPRPRAKPWRPACCGVAVRVLARGYGLGVLAAELGVGRTTLRAWRRDHPEFAEAVARGLSLAARPVGRGRPTGWRPEHNATAEAVLARGYSLRVVAAELGVCPHTVANWTRAHPDFADAVGRGRAAGARVWEDRLAAVADGESRGQPRAIAFALKNLYPEDWSGRARDAEVKAPVVTLAFVRPPDGAADGPSGQARG